MKPELTDSTVTKQLFTFGRFLASGGLATALHWGVMAIFVTLGVNAAVASAAGAALGAVSNYVLQFHITFQARAQHGRAMPAYFAVVCVSWLTNLLVFMGLHAGFALAVTPAQGVTTFLVAVLNFWLYSTVVFHEKPITTMDS